MRQLVKKMVITVGGLSLGAILSCMLVLLSGFAPLTVSGIKLSSKFQFNHFSIAKSGPRVLGDIPLDQPVFAEGFVAPELVTKKELLIALKQKSEQKALDGMGGGFYFGKGKDIFSPKEGVFDILAIKEHLLKLSSLKNEESSTFPVRNKMEVLVQGVPVGAPVLGRLSSNFGRRSSPFGRQADFHTGIDIASIYNSPVVSSAEGEVVFAGTKGTYGKTILIRHKNGLETLYAHLSKIQVKVGDHVNRGQKIALLGSSGRSTGPHLHYEVRLDGSPVNPKNFIDIAKIIKSVG